VAKFAKNKQISGKNLEKLCYYFHCQLGHFRGCAGELMKVKRNAVFLYFILKKTVDRLY
jgi:hypothetical protein